LSELTIQQLARDAATRWSTVLGITGLCVASAVTWVFVTPEIYRAEVLLMPTSSQEGSGSGGLSSQLGGLASLAGMSLTGTEQRKAEAVATLQSRLLTDAFVRDNNLLPELFAERWDAEKKAWKPEGRRAPTLWDANKLVDKDIRHVDVDKRTGLVTLTIDWTGPAEAAKWANELVERTNALLRRRAIDNGERSVQYIEKQLALTSIVEVRQALFNLVESELKTIMLAQSSPEYAFKIIDPAVVPEEKIKPKRALVVAGSLIAGLFLSLLLVVVRGPSSKPTRKAPVG
jgi:uncharacterized protein involved in exopolysaccharide biosynthesis